MSWNYDLGVSSAMEFSRIYNNSEKNLILGERADIELEPGALIMQTSIVNGTYMERFSAVNRCLIDGPVGIGSFAYVADSKLDKYVHIGARSVIGGFEHPTDRLSMSGLFWGQNSYLLGTTVATNFKYQNVKPSNRQTVIESDVWVAANCVVLPGRHLSVGTVLGSGAVLTRDTEPYGIYVGNPARCVRFRFDSNVIAELLESQWWKLPAEFLLTLNMADISECLASIRNYRSQLK